MWFRLPFSSLTCILHADKPLMSTNTGSGSVCMGVVHTLQSVFTSVRMPPALEPRAWSSGICFSHATRWPCALCPYTDFGHMRFSFMLLFPVLFSRWVRRLANWMSHQSSIAFDDVKCTSYGRALPCGVPESELCTSLRSK